MTTAVSPKKPLSLDQLKELSKDPSRITAEIYSVLLTMADPVEETRAWAADCLQAVEKIDSTIAAEIVPLCQHESAFVVYWAVVMLGKSGNVIAYQTQLTEVLRAGPTLTARQAAANVLRLAHGASQETKNALTEAASSSDPRLKRLAEQALSEIG